MVSVNVRAIVDNVLKLDDDAHTTLRTSGDVDATSEGPDEVASISQPGSVDPDDTVEEPAVEERPAPASQKDRATDRV